MILIVTSMLFLKRFKTRDVPSTVLKGAPDFCTVYVIGREKISSVRSATGALPPKPKAPPSPRKQIEHHLQRGLFLDLSILLVINFSPHNKEDACIVNLILSLLTQVSFMNAASERTQSPPCSSLPDDIKFK